MDLEMIEVRASDLDFDFLKANLAVESSDDEIAYLKKMCYWAAPMKHPSEKTT